MTSQSITPKQETLPYKLHGNKSSSILIIFIHGFPNTMKMWKDYIKYYQDTHYILSLSYPNYVTSDIELDNQEPRSEVADSNWGVSTSDIVKRFKNTIDLVNKEKRKIILVGHDYGAFFSFALDKEYPNLVNDMVILDVSYDTDMRLDLNTFILIIYQLTFSFCFLIGYPIGDFLIWFVLKKCFKAKDDQVELISSKTCYHYYYIWKNLTIQILLLWILYISAVFLGFISIIYGYILMTIGVLICFALYTPSFTFKEYKDHLRLVFIYSNDKLIRFHSDSWVKKIKGLSQNNETIAVTGKHWFLLYRKEEIMNIISRRIKQM